jgi:hypothetical protein
MKLKLAFAEGTTSCEEDNYCIAGNPRMMRIKIRIELSNQLCLP